MTPNEHLKQTIDVMDADIGHLDVIKTGITHLNSTLPEKATACAIGALSTSITFDDGVLNLPTMTISSEITSASSEAIKKSMQDFAEREAQRAGIIARLEASKAEVATVASLQTRIRSLEESVTTMQAKIDSMSAQITRLR